MIARARSRSGHKRAMVGVFHEGTLRAEAHQIDLASAEEDVMPNTAVKQGGDGVCVGAVIQGCIYDRIKRSPGKRLGEVCSIATIAAQAFDVTGQFVRGLPAVEHCDAMAAGEQLKGQKVSEVAGAANDQDVQRIPLCRSARWRLVRALQAPKELGLEHVPACGLVHDPAGVFGQQ
jgi:hypothetical protein